MSVFLENIYKDRVELPEEVAKKFFRTVAGAYAIASMGEDGHQASAARTGSDGGVVAIAEDAEDVEDVEADAEGLHPSSHQRAAEDADNEPLKLSDLEYSRATLEATVAYAMASDSLRTTSIPKPLSRPLREIITSYEIDFLLRAEHEAYLIELLDIASYLKFEQLVNLCSAYMAVRIDEISKAAPTIMDGAQLVRDFLHMENEWTEEEMVHLRKEMEYAKQVDPRVY